MVYGCGNKCVKYLVFLFNFLVFVVGVVVLGVSLGIRYNNDIQKYFQKLLDGAQDTSVNIGQLYIPLYVLMGIGALLLLTGFLGCCGACTENTCLLSLFFSIILILFVAELGCGIAILVNKNQFKDAMTDAITKNFVHYGEPKYEEYTKSVDQMQNEMKCCGCKGITDFHTGKIPPTCGIGPGQYTVGCCDKIWSEAEGQLAIVGGVAIGILVIELLAMIFSCILCQAFRRGDYQYA